MHTHLRFVILLFFFSSRRRHTRSLCDWSSDVCSSDLTEGQGRTRMSTRVLQDDPSPIGARGPGFPSAPSGFRRSEERRVGKECRSRESPYQQSKKNSSTATRTSRS